METPAPTITATIFRDDFGETPREWCNLGIIHQSSRYNLGDQPIDDFDMLIAEVASINLPLPLLYSLAADHLCPDGYSDLRGDWQDELADAKYSSCSDEDKRDILTCWLEGTARYSDRYTRPAIELLEANIPFSLLYLYDHSGITISTSPFSCPWDSGCIGFIYVPNTVLLKEYGDTGPDTIFAAQRRIEAEIKTLDQFITGDVYAYSIQSHDPDADPDAHYAETLDSCCGFYGLSLDNGMLDNCPSEYTDILTEAINAASDDYTLIQE